MSPPFSVAGPVLRKVTSERIEEIARTESHQGVVAFAEPVQNVELVRLVQSSEQPFLVALDGVTDPGNLGAILRTAADPGRSTQWATAGLEWHWQRTPKE